MPPKGKKKGNKGKKPVLAPITSSTGLSRTPSGSFDPAATGEQLYNIEEILSEKSEKSDCKCNPCAPQLTVTENFNVLKWWRAHKGIYPNLIKMVRNVLGCPLSSAGVERLFSARAECTPTSSKACARS